MPEWQSSGIRATQVPMIVSSELHSFSRIWFRMKLSWTDSTWKSPLHRSILLLTIIQLLAPRPMSHMIQLSLSWANNSKEIHKSLLFTLYPLLLLPVQKKRKYKKIPTWPQPEFRKKIWEGRVPALWPSAKKKELLSPALFCSHPTPGVTTAPGSFPGCSPPCSCFGAFPSWGRGALLRVSCTSTCHTPGTLI